MKIKLKNIIAQLKNSKESLTSRMKREVRISVVKSKGMHLDQICRE